MELHLGSEVRHFFKRPSPAPFQGKAKAAWVKDAGSVYILPHPFCSFRSSKGNSPRPHRDKTHGFNERQLVGSPKKGV